MWFGFQQPLVGGTLRDDTKNGCVADYCFRDPRGLFSRERDMFRRQTFEV